MLNLLYNKLGCLKLEIYCKLKQYSFHTYCPVVKSAKKKEVTMYFTLEGTFHRVHHSHSVIASLVHTTRFWNCSTSGTCLVTDKPQEHHTGIRK